MNKLDIQSRLLCLLIIIMKTDQDDPTPGFKNGLFQSEDDRKEDLKELTKKYIFKDTYPNSKAWVFLPGEAIRSGIPVEDVVIKTCFEQSLWEVSWLNESIDSIMWDDIQDGINSQNLTEEQKLLVTAVDQYLKEIEFKF